MKAIIKKGTRTKKDQFRFVLVANNGEPIATSEHYLRKATMKRTLSKYFPQFTIQDTTIKK